MFASDGFLSNSFYIICEADQQGGNCSTTGNITHFIGVGGTSSAAPTFAAIMSLVNQRMASLSLNSRQGDANYILYPLAAQQVTNAYDCNSSHAGSTLDSRCTFYDVTKGNNSVPCASGHSELHSSTSRRSAWDSLGERERSIEAWNAGTGYDLATGLGTINTANLITNWATARGSFAGTTTTLCLVAGSVASPVCATPPAMVSITHGSTISGVIGVTPNPGASTITKPEDVALVLSGSGGTPVDRFDPNTGNVDIYSLNSSGQFSGPFTMELVGGSYNVSAHYAGDGHSGPSDSNAISVTVSPENSTAKVTVQTVNLATNVLSTLTSVPYGDFNLVRADITGMTSGFETATGSVTLKDNGNPIVNPGGGTTSSFNLNTEGYLEDQTTFLAVGAHSFVANYNGDPSYNASTSPAVAFTVTHHVAPTERTSVNATSDCTDAHSAHPAPRRFTQVRAVTLNVCVDTELAANPGGGSLGAAATGTITFTVPKTSAVFRPVGPLTSPTLITITTGALIGILLLLVIYAAGSTGFPARRRWGMAPLVMLFAIVVGAGVSCGGGGGSTTTQIGTASAANTSDKDGFVAVKGALTFTPTATETVTVAYSGDGNYKSSSATIMVTVQ